MALYFLMTIPKSLVLEFIKSCEPSNKKLTQVMKEFRLSQFDLSCNSIGEKGGLLLGNAIAANESLEMLNLSWNNLRRKGAIAVANGLKNNVMLKTCNLAWNGFGDEGAVSKNKLV